MCFGLRPSFCLIVESSFKFIVTRGCSLGFLNPLLYSSPQALFDIVALAPIQSPPVACYATLSNPLPPPLPPCGAGTAAADATRWAWAAARTSSSAQQATPPSTPPSHPLSTFPSNRIVSSCSRCISPPPPPPPAISWLGPLHRPRRPQLPHHGSACNVCVTHAMYACHPAAVNCARRRSLSQAARPLPSPRPHALARPCVRATSHSITCFRCTCGTQPGKHPPDLPAAAFFLFFSP